MGACAGHPGSQKHIEGDKNSRFKPLEIDLIRIMYDNLAKRCRNNVVNRETFDLFFHSSGLVGQILFLKFDSQKTGTISFVQFLGAFGVMLKGTLRERADILFDIYDVNGNDGVRFQELLKILYSYSLEELNKMFAEQKFLKYLEANHLNFNHFFGPEQIERNIIDEESQIEEQSNKNGKNAVPSSVVLCRVHTDVNGSQKDTSANFNGKKWENITNKKPKKKFQINSTVFGDTAIGGKVKRKNFKIRSNVASLTRQYARFLFVSSSLNKNKDVFKKQHFFKLIQDHPSLFQAYLAGFHTYIWQVDDLGDPEYLKAEPWIQSEAQEHYQQQKVMVHLKFIQKTIFVMNRKKKIPRDIINLQGLTVDTFQTERSDKEYGLVFKHRDGLYPAKGYYFRQKNLFDEWNRHLTEFKTTAIEDLYIRQQKIGGGNYSNVFKGKEKKTGNQVAIKVIETYKLTPGQREVLKRETGILKQCHHPNIIKFLGEFKTKTHIYIVTEILTEGDLYEYTKRNGFLEEYEAGIVLKQLIDSILYLNEELGIIHRDLKPENVLVKINEERKIVHRVKLIDFGFGVFKDKLQDLTPKQKFAGTPGFIAPQIYNAQDYDYKIDTFSLGIILYFMLSGNFPFHSQFLEEIEQLTKTCSISMVNNHWGNVSDEAKDLIKRVLCYKQKRITTREMADHPWLKNLEKLKEYKGRNSKINKGFLE